MNKGVIQQYVEFLDAMCVTMSGSLIAAKDVDLVAKQARSALTVLIQLALS